MARVGKRLTGFSVLFVLLAGCTGSCRHGDSGKPWGSAPTAGTRDKGTPAPAESVAAALSVNPCGSGPGYPFPAGPSYPSQAGPKTLSRTTSWAPGIPGGVPKRTTICQTLSPTGNADNVAINQALKNCPANQVVKLNPGTYNIKEAITWSKNDVVLRGSGGPGAGRATQTRLIADPTLYGPVVNIGLDLFPHAEGANEACTSDAIQGTKSVTVANAKRFKVGDLVMIDMLIEAKNDTGKWLLDAPAGGTGLSYPYSEFNPEKSPKGSESRTWFMRDNRPTSQIMEIEAIEGERLLFSSPFHLTFDVAHAAQITAFKYNGEQSAPVSNAGLEDLYVSGVPAPGGKSQHTNIALTLAKYSWVKNVESDQSSGDSIGIDSSFRCIVRDSYMHSTINATPGGAGYGLEFSHGAADNLAENNISWNFNKIMVMRSSGGGNVVAYNYMDDGYIAYQPNWVETGLNAAHMTSSHFELFEGNLSFALGSENTWGNSTFITWLRNLGTGHRSAWPPLNTFVFNTKADKAGGCSSEGPGDQKCIPYTDKAPRAAAVLSYGHVFYNFIGNVLGYQDMPVAPQEKGFTFASEGPEWPKDPVPMWMIGFDVHSDTVDQGVVNTTYRDANYDFATKTVQPQGAKRAVPASLYLCQKPAFFGGYTWPWVDGSNAGAPYQKHTYRFNPLSKTLGTYSAEGAPVDYAGFALPAFVRFLQLHGVEAVDPACKTATLSDVKPSCSLLLTGSVAP
ncbi:MAG TPA: hypothetical protein VG937_25465 [Polyangiaceae bacterium]|nr:hypothetical protein [Polyangiaceae bacterium]